MLRALKSALLSVSLILTLLVAPLPAVADMHIQKTQSQQTAALFDPTKVISISIVRAIGGPSLTKSYLDTENYRRAAIKIRLSGETQYRVFYDVGVRLKGSYTRRFEKFSIKVKFDAFKEDQNFLGLKRLTLNAMMQDNSMLHEAAAYKLYRAAGVPAPRVGYAKVKVDGAYFGLYANIESVDRSMLKNWFGDKTEHLYSSPINCDLTPDRDCHVATIGDTNRKDLIRMQRIHLLDGKDWWRAFKKYADEIAVLRLMAVDTYISHWDGFTAKNHNNYYTHFDKDGVMTILPWGTDQTFPMETKKQMSWDGTPPVREAKSTTMSTLLVHCINYQPCYDEFLRQSVYVANLVDSIHLQDFKNTITRKVLTASNLKNDISHKTPDFVKIRSEWFDHFLGYRKAAFLNFFELRSATKLRTETPKTIKVNTRITPTIEALWEPGVQVEYQWLANGQPIKGATDKSFKPNSDFFGKSIRLQITLKKPNVAATVQTTKAIKVTN